MTIDRSAFEAYRRAPDETITVGRLVLGTMIIVTAWILSTLLAIFAGTHLYSLWRGGTGSLPAQADFLTTPAGVLTALASFGGIWAGVWAAMRWVHGSDLAALLGNSRRVSRMALLKGLVAVVLTSLLTEILLYLLQPEMRRGSIGAWAWLAGLIPLVMLAFVQTSAEELLFRGYLLRGLANRFRSPFAWGLLPILVFTALHWSPGNVLAVNISVAVSIAAFAVVLVLLVHATGNLGASFGCHLGNNLTGFLLISHEENYGAFSLYSARALEAPGWTAQDAVLISLIGIVASALTAVLLLHPRSPLRVTPDSG